MTDRRFSPAFSTVLFATLVACSFPILTCSAQAGTSKSPPTKPAAVPAKPAAADAKPESPYKPYKDIITSKAVSQVGTITVHRIDDHYFYEIPVSQLDKPYMWVTEIAQLSSGTGYGGTAVGNTVVRWSRRDKHMDLRAVTYDIRAEDGVAIKRAVANSSLDPIIATFDIVTEGQKHAPVIEVTHFLLADTPELSPKGGLGGEAPDASRSYIDKVKAFPTNVEAHVVWTVPGGNRGQSLSAMVNYSMVELPAVPMQGRYSDSRVGYFTEDFQDYSAHEQGVVDRHYITRFRLEKKHPELSVSDPKTPITFYISREVPEKWRPFIKAGIEAWQSPLEGAGFSNAIVARDAPTVQEDPDWDAEDARYNVIRWAPTSNENAMGPHVDDPRSGEIIESHVIVWHNVLKLLQDWYFVQASPSDVEAQKLPLPDKLEGKLLQYVVTHEIGHTLGLQHNFKASAAYTVKQLRDPIFTAKWGDEASIMDYGRFNYVAQPEDHANLIPKLGPYDFFAIRWGYTPIPSAKSPNDEKLVLNQIASEQRLHPELRFGNDHFEDPTDQREDLSDDPVVATRLGLKNIDRVAGYLLSATTDPGGDYDLLKGEFSQLNAQRTRELSNVVQLVGGIVNTDWHAGYGGPSFAPIPRFRQREAVSFLLDSVFTKPGAIYQPELLYRVQSMGLESTVDLAQQIVLAELLSEDRLERMSDTVSLQSAPAYRVRELFTDLEDGLWSELKSPAPKISWFRRVAQREFIEQLRSKVRSGSVAAVSESSAAAQAVLVDLTHRVSNSLKMVKDIDTRNHLANCLTSLRTALPARAPEMSVFPAAIGSKIVPETTYDTTF